MKFKELATLKVDNESGDYVSPGIVDTQKVSEERAAFVKNECDTGRGYVICIDPNDYVEETPDVSFSLSDMIHADTVSSEGNKDEDTPESSSDSDACGDNAGEGAASSSSPAPAKDVKPLEKKKK